MRGRIWVLFVVQAGGGLFISLMGVTSTSFGATMTCVVLSAFFIEATCGAVSCQLHLHGPGLDVWVLTDQLGSCCPAYQGCLVSPREHVQLHVQAAPARLRPYACYLEGCLS